MLFRAIAGLWPWGSGQIALPSSNSVMFVPRHPYVPLGTLRGALAYRLCSQFPTATDSFDSSNAQSLGLGSCRHQIFPYNHTVPLRVSPAGSPVFPISLSPLLRKAFSTAPPQVATGQLPKAPTAMSYFIRQCL
jgi:hypothetical protein